MDKYNYQNVPALKIHLMKSASGSFFIKILSAAFGLISGIVLARTLGASGYGVYAFAISLISLLSIPAAMGLPQVLVREIAAYRINYNWGLIKGLIRRANQLSFLVAMGMAVGGIIILAYWNPSVSAYNFKAVSAGLILVVFMPLSRLSMSALRGFKHIVLSQLPEFVFQPIAFIFLLIFLFVFRDKNLLPYQAITCQVLAAGVCLLSAYIFIKKKLPQEIKAVSLEFNTRKWLTSAFPLLLAGGMQFINMNTDILMLGVLSEAQDVGVYRVAQRLANLVTFSLAAVNMAIAPTFSELYHQDHIPRIQKLMAKSAGMSLLYSVPLSLVLIFVGKQIIVFVFGPEFGMASTPLSILAVAQLFNGMMGSVGVLLNMSGYERDATKGLAVSCACNILLNACFIPKYGVLGAAMATGISIMVWNLILGIYVFKRLHIYPGVFGMVKSA